MIVRKLRLQRGWSQDQLAEMSGLNVRTVQRIERGKAASLESLKSLAAVFETDVSQLQPENDMDRQTGISREEQEALEYVDNLRGFYMNVISFLVFMPAFIWFNLTVTPAFQWFWFMLLGWGVGLLLHGLLVFDGWGFGPEWERRQVEKRLGRKL